MMPPGLPSLPHSAPVKLASSNAMPSVASANLIASALPRASKYLRTTGPVGGRMPAPTKGESTASGSSSLVVLKERRRLGEPWSLARLETTRTATAAWRAHIRKDVEDRKGEREAGVGERKGEKERKD